MEFTKDWKMGKNMKNKIKIIKVDWWNHQQLSEKIINRIQASIKKTDEVWDLDCVPKLKKPHFWEFWKFSGYNRECRKILNQLETYLTSEYES